MVDAEEVRHRSASNLCIILQQMIVLSDTSASRESRSPRRCKQARTVAAVLPESRSWIRPPLSDA